MKKIRTILTGILLILTLSIFTACGNNNAPADEAGTAAEENTTDTGTNENADAVNDKKEIWDEAGDVLAEKLFDKIVEMKFV